MNEDKKTPVTIAEVNNISEALGMPLSLPKQDSTPSSDNPLSETLSSGEPFGLPEETPVEVGLDSLNEINELIGNDGLSENPAAEPDANNSQPPETPFDPNTALDEVNKAIVERTTAEKKVQEEIEKLVNLDTALLSLSVINPDSAKVKDGLHELSPRISKNFLEEIGTLFNTLNKNEKVLDKELVEEAKKQMYYTCHFCGKDNIKGTECGCKKERDVIFEKINSLAQEVKNLGKEVRNGEIRKVKILNAKLGQLSKAIKDAKKKKVEIPNSIFDEILKDQVIVTTVNAKKLELAKKQFDKEIKRLNLKFEDLEFMAGNPDLDKKRVWGKKKKTVREKFKKFKRWIGTEKKLGVFNKRTPKEQEKINKTIERGNTILGRINPKKPKVPLGQGLRNLTQGTNGGETN